LKALRKGTRTPIIAVINAGSAVDLAAIEPYADAILLAWYPGQEGGNALADILFGKVSPSGRLPITFYQSLNDLPPYENYSMNGRTYRYFAGRPQYPFGYGLSYSTFEYKWSELPNVKMDSVRFSVTIKNKGQYNGEEVVQAYVKYPASPNMPLKELKGFQRIDLVREQQGTVTFKIPVEELKKWDERTHSWKLNRGDYEIFVGGNSADERIKSNLKL
jgi:beta-glucosidase